MVIKINYTSSDVYVSTSVSPVYVVVNYSAVNNGGGGAIWGGITGTLSDQTDLQDALDDKVPYTGATANVNLGEYELKAGQMTLDTSPTGTAAVGTTRWNDTIGSSETTLKGGSVILKNGVDLVARVVNKVSPNTTLTKAAYQAVRVSGAQGQRLAVAFAQANNDANSADTIGLVTETIATNQEGFIICVGQIEDINTTGSLQGETWVDGDVLYLSPTTPGAITKVKPTGNGHIVVIGYVEYAHANHGKIYVKVMNGWELDELHDVSIVSPANNEALIYESATSLWKNKTIASALGYTPISGSGATGQVAYWNGTSSQTGSNNLFWDAANARLGIGIALPTSKLHILGAGTTSATTPLRISDSAGTLLMQLNDIGHLTLASNQQSKQARIYMTGYNTYPALTISSSSTILSSVDNSDLYFYGNTIRFYNGTGGTEWARFFNTSNLVLQNGGTFTDGGQRLQVMGDAFIKGSGNTSATSGLIVQDSAGTQRFKVGNDGVVEISNRLKLNTIAGLSTGTVNIDASLSLLNSSSGSYTRIALGSQSVSSSGNFTSSGFQDNVLTNITSTSTLDYTSFLASPTLTALTAGSIYKAFGWTNNSGWGLYGAGTANNYLGGRLLIKTSTVGIYDLDVNGTARVSGTQPLTVTGTFANKNGISFNTENGVAGAIRLTDHYSQKGSSKPALEIYGTGNTDTLSTIPAISIVNDSVIVGSTIRAFGYLLPNSSYINFSNNSANFIASFSQGNGYGAGNATQYKIGYSNASLPSKIVMAFTHSDNLATRANYYDSLNQFGSDLTSAPISASAYVDIMGSTTGNSSLRIRQGTAPTSPNNGDIWFDGTDLKIRVGGVTRTIVLL
jgi:hypothetical protein